MYYSERHGQQIVGFRASKYSIRRVQ